MNNDNKKSYGADAIIGWPKPLNKNSSFADLLDYYNFMQSELNSLRVQGQNYFYSEADSMEKRENKDLKYGLQEQRNFRKKPRTSKNSFNKKRKAQSIFEREKKAVKLNTYFKEYEKTLENSCTMSSSTKDDYIDLVSDNEDQHENGENSFPNILILQNEDEEFDDALTKARLMLQEKEKIKMDESDEGVDLNLEHQMDTSSLEKKFVPKANVKNYLEENNANRTIAHVLEPSVSNATQNKLNYKTHPSIKQGDERTPLSYIQPRENTFFLRAKPKINLEENDTNKTIAQRVDPPQKNFNYKTDNLIVDKRFPLPVVQPVVICVNHDSSSEESATESDHAENSEQLIKTYENKSKVAEGKKPYVKINENTQISEIVSVLSESKQREYKRLKELIAKKESKKSDNKSEHPSMNSLNLLQKQLVLATTLLQEQYVTFRMLMLQANENKTAFMNSQVVVQHLKNQLQLAEKEIIERDQIAFQACSQLQSVQLSYEKNTTLYRELKDKCQKLGCEIYGPLFSLPDHF